MIDEGALTLFLLITARISGCVLFNPLMGRQNFPGTFRAGMVLIFSVFTYSITGGGTNVPTSVLEFGVKLLLELALGFLLGMVVQIFFYIPQLAGHVIDTQMGMTMSQIYDAGSQANLSVTGVLLNTLMMLLFFAANGHHTFLRIMMTSGEIVPYGAVAIGSQAAQAMLTLFAECTILAVKLCMPILAAEMIGQLGMGVLMKVIPQINVFSINIELKVIIGLVLLLTLITPFSEFFLDLERDMLQDLTAILRMSGGT